MDQHPRPPVNISAFPTPNDRAIIEWLNIARTLHKTPLSAEAFYPTILLDQTLKFLQSQEFQKAMQTALILDHKFKHSYNFEKA